MIGSKACEDGFRDLDEEDANGCEHQCYAFPPSDEQCNGEDDDCDDVVDEDVANTDPEIGDSCGSDIGACVAGQGDEASRRFVALTI